MRVFHVSEEPNIEIFHPRPASAFTDLNKEVVFAVSETLLHNYLLPRDCPRVTYCAGQTTTEEDKKNFLSDNFLLHCNSTQVLSTKAHDKQIQN